MPTHVLHHCELWHCDALYGASPIWETLGTVCPEEAHPPEPAFMWGLVLQVATCVDQLCVKGY